MFFDFFTPGLSGPDMTGAMFGGPKSNWVGKPHYPGANLKLDASGVKSANKGQESQTWHTEWKESTSKQLKAHQNWCVLLFRAALGTQNEISASNDISWIRSHFDVFFGMNDERSGMPEAVDAGCRHRFWVPFQGTTLESCWSNGSTTYSTFLGTLHLKEGLGYKHTTRPGTWPNFSVINLGMKLQYTQRFWACEHDQSPRSESTNCRSLFIAPLPPQSQELGCCDSVP